MVILKLQLEWAFQRSEWRPKVAQGSYPSLGVLPSVGHETLFDPAFPTT